MTLLSDLKGLTDSLESGEFAITDSLIDQIQIQLIRISPNEEHIAYRSACVVHEVKRRSTDVVPQPSPPVPPPSPNVVMKSSPQHFIDARRLSTETIQPPMLSSSPLMTTIPEGYPCLAHLLGFGPPPSPTPGFGPVSLTSDMPAVVHHF
ncbi:hypothetical protein VTN77DRAFT_9443 [Rasamsonia byssochlamydoides]|uniref:uncharacterized protein n=1 Tax=Rasamsonia byssochlamydoides TaxID=89139 RepID=UPI003742C32A